MVFDVFVSEAFQKGQFAVKISFFFLKPRNKNLISFYCVHCFYLVKLLENFQYLKKGYAKCQERKSANTKNIRLFTSVLQKATCKTLFINRRRKILKFPKHENHKYLLCTLKFNTQIHFCISLIEFKLLFGKSLKI